MVVYGKMKFTPLWGSIVIKLSHLLLTISSALNIVIYSYKVRLHIHYTVHSTATPHLRVTTLTSILNAMPQSPTPKFSF